MLLSATNREKAGLRDFLDPVGFGAPEQSFHLAVVSPVTSG
jgi:hypothetical protein